MTDKQHIFLSYCRDNVDEAEKLRAQLENRGFDVWWDRDIPIGGDWQLERDRALEKSCAVVACFSKQVRERDNSGIYPELRDAIKSYRRLPPGSLFIFPVRFSPCPIPRLPIDDTRKLSDLQFLDLFPEPRYELGIDRLVASLKKSPASAFVDAAVGLVDSSLRDLGVGAGWSSACGVQQRPTSDRSVFDPACLRSTKGSGREQRMTSYQKTKSRITVMGDIMISRYFVGDVERLNPEAPGVVIRVDREDLRPGGAASVAMIASSLEAKETLADVIGSDMPGSQVRALLKEHDVTFHLWIAEDRPTTTKNRLLVRGQLRPDRFDCETTSEIGDDVAAYLASCQLGDALLVQDSGKGVCTTRLLQSLLTRSREANIPVLVDRARGRDWQD